MLFKYDKEKLIQRIVYHINKLTEREERGWLCLSEEEKLSELKMALSLIDMEDAGAPLLTERELTYLLQN